MTATRMSAFGGRAEVDRRVTTTLSGRSVDRHNPKTWRGKVGNKHIYTKRGRIRLRQEIENMPFLRDLLPENPVVKAVAKQLLGNDIVESSLRGVFTIFPIPRAIFLPGKAHVDGRQCSWA